MKSLRKGLTIITVFFALMPFLASAQSAFSDPGTISKADPRFTEITVAGMLSGTDSLETSNLDLANATGVVQFSYYLNASDDSVKVSFKIKGSDHTGKSYDLATLADADSTETYKVVVDTVDARWLNTYSLSISGSTGNGDSTYFNGKLKILK